MPGIVASAVILAVTISGCETSLGTEPGTTTTTVPTVSTTTTTLAPGTTTTTTTTTTIASALPNQVPVVSIGSDRTAANGASVTFTAAASDPEGTALTYAWYLDGTKQTGETASTFSMTRSPVIRTKYQIKVSVSDGALSAEAQVVLTILSPIEDSETEPTLFALYYGDGQTWSKDSLPLPAGSRSIAVCENAQSPDSRTWYVLTKGNRIFLKDGDWKEKGTAPEGSVSLASAGPVLYVLTSEGALHEFVDGGWKKCSVPPPTGSFALASTGNILYSLTTERGIYRLEDGGTVGGTWKEYGTAPSGSIAVAFDNGALKALTTSDRIHTYEAGWETTSAVGPSGGVGMICSDNKLVIITNN